MTESTLQKLEDHISKFPASPGVYLMKSDKGEVIYVGKARSLKSRVRSYFNGHDERYHVKFLMKRVDSIEVMVTGTEKEALIVEDILIKKHRPRYNINLKDDKTYLSLKIDMNLDYPRVEVVRIKKKDDGKGVRYFGPYASAQALRETLALIQKVFPLRTCRESNFKNRVRPCLSYQIKRCSGPCCGHIGIAFYRAMMEEVVLFLEGRSGEIISRFKKRMKEAAGELEFEEAARLRDCIDNIKRTLEKQRVFTRLSDERDVVGLFREGTALAIYVLFIREGKVSGGKGFNFTNQEMPDSEIISSFVRRYYSGGRYVPAEVIIPCDIEDIPVMEEWLGELREKRVRLTCPRRGDKVNLLQMASKNAGQTFVAGRKKELSGQALLEEVMNTFSLKKIPQRMECFDISNIQGTNATGSTVVFINGEARKDKYRRFKIKGADGSDDFAMMYEVLTRRLNRGLDEKDLPDLIVVDGGRGQLGVAMKALEESGLSEEIDLLALAKEKVFHVKGGKEKRDERVYAPGRKNPLKLKERSGMLFLFQRIRDEAHRFAVAYHKKLRGKKALSSPLDDIKGLGPVTKKALISRFGSLQGIIEASAGELASVKGISRTFAGTLLKELARRSSQE
ncbi:MAG: excinuclease ABC subunit UvrC [Deltaproteobacteria bacterium]|nr:excinuclease ABC subunit UvrC [Deltaproteobacteria bacterium]